MMARRRRRIDQALRQATRRVPCEWVAHVTPVPRGPSGGATPNTQQPAPTNARAGGPAIEAPYQPQRCHDRSTRSPVHGSPATRCAGRRRQPRGWVEGSGLSVLLLHGGPSAMSTSRALRPSSFQASPWPPTSNAACPHPRCRARTTWRPRPPTRRRSWTHLAGNEPMWWGTRGRLLRVAALPALTRQDLRALIVDPLGAVGDGGIASLGVPSSPGCRRPAGAAST